MDSQDIRHRGGDDRDAATTAMAETDRKQADDNNKGQRDQKRAMAKRGLKSLTVAVAAPVLVMLFETYFLGGGGYGSRQSAALFGCYKAFNEISPVAGNLVKPCLACAAFVTAVNVKLAIA
ncbi:hypothetical protein HID58_031398 [Brassica napus]|uniref:CASP-like protein n=1 Tax=Brassica napus TaxID=3708 RepID=A0ABQ8BUB5_BRANA|nr:hypothetical protein HID58_031398 [Brassica napus]